MYPRLRDCRLRVARDPDAKRNLPKDLKRPLQPFGIAAKARSGRTFVQVAAVQWSGFSLLPRWA